MGGCDRYLIKCSPRRDVPGLATTAMDYQMMLIVRTNVLILRTMAVAITSRICLFVFKVVGRF